MLPKRRFWTVEQSAAYAFLNEFSVSASPKRILTPLKSIQKRIRNVLFSRPISSLGEHKFVSKSFCKHFSSLLSQIEYCRATCNFGMCDVEFEKSLVFMFLFVTKRYIQ
jgi:hypothetical protein